MSRRVIGIDKVFAAMSAEPTMADQPKKVAAPPLPTLPDLGVPSSISGGRKNFPAGPDRDKRDELVRSLVASGIPKDEAERAVFGDDTKAPLAFLTRADEVSPDAGARHALAVLASIVAANQGVPFGDALRIVLKDPVHAPLAAAIQPDANGYAIDDQERDLLAAAAQLDKLAREYQRTEKVPYVDALRAVGAEHPELVEAREGLYGEQVSA